MLIELYVYNKETGEYLYQDIGNPDFVIKDLGDDKDFTLKPPPDGSKIWRWLNGKWV